MGYRCIQFKGKIFTFIPYTRNYCILIISEIHINIPQKVQHINWKIYNKNKIIEYLSQSWLSVISMTAEGMGRALGCECNSCEGLRYKRLFLRILIKIKVFN